MKLAREKKRAFFEPIILSERKFFNICFISMYSYWIHFQNIHIFYVSKNLLVIKTVESLHCVLNVEFRIFVNASPSAFFKSHWNINKVKNKFFWKTVDTLLFRILSSWNVPKFKEKCLVKLELLIIVFGTENYRNVRP